jgi:hypothetical protein
MSWLLLSNWVIYRGYVLNHFFSEERGWVQRCWSVIVYRAFYLQQ